jgi:hypothetical protein
MSKKEQTSDNHEQGNSSLGVVMHRPSTKYRLMIYFAHSTMVLYGKTLVSHEQMNPEEFYNANKKVMQRVFDEAINIMAYELSHNQMMKACYFYLSSKYYPQSVDETETFVLDGA